MTAQNPNSPQWFQQILDYANDAKQKASAVGGSMNNVLNQAQGVYGPYPNYAQNPNASAFGRGLGEFVNTATGIAGKGRVLAPLALVGNLMDDRQGPVADVAGAGTGLLAMKALAPLAEGLVSQIPYVGPLARTLVKPAVFFAGNALGQNLTEKATDALGKNGGPLAGLTSAASRGSQESLDQALNPANPRNTVDASIEKQLDTFNKLRETLGDERAAAIAFQKQALTNAADVNNIDMLNRVGAAALATTFTSPARMIDQQNQGAIENTKSILNEAGALARQYAAAGNPYTVNYA